MDVFVIPLGGERYELYCEVEDDLEDDAADRGWTSRWRRRFREMVRASEDGSSQRDVEPATGWMGRLQARIVGWVAERVAEQRLLWNLRRQTDATLHHPAHLSFEQSRALVMRMLAQDHQRHRGWLIVHTALTVVTGPGLFFVPGPNLVAYYFTFRAVGHWLSMRGAKQGLSMVQWSGRTCPELDALQDVLAIDPVERSRRLDEAGLALGLERLAVFVERQLNRPAAG